MVRRPSRSNVALNIRISCVLGSTNLHTKTQNATIRDIRKKKDITPRSIAIFY